MHADFKLILQWIIMEHLLYTEHDGKGLTILFSIAEYASSCGAWYAMVLF